MRDAAPGIRFFADSNQFGRMQQQFSTLELKTSGPGLYLFTGKADSFVAQSAIADGLLTCFVRHTSASLVIQETADPDVQRDLATFLDRLVSRNPQHYRHNAEGPDDMPSHIRSMLTQTSLSIPFRNGKLLLGTWQGLYLFEHRDDPHRREVLLHAMGD